MTIHETRSPNCVACRPCCGRRCRDARTRRPQPEAPPAVPPLATVDVLVAKSDLDTGKTIDAADVGWQTWPAASAGPTFVKQTDRPEAIKDFVGAIVRSPILAGEAIRDSKVVLAKGGGFLAAILPHGKRGISLDIAPDTDAGGFIFPNDHVDVVLTQKLNANPGFKSQIILSNVRVLAVDQVLGEKGRQKSHCRQNGDDRSRSTAGHHTCEFPPVGDGFARATELARLANNGLRCK